MADKKKAFSKLLPKQQTPAPTQEPVKKRRLRFGLNKLKQMRDPNSTTSDE